MAIILPGAPSAWVLKAMQAFAAGGLVGDVFLHMMAHMPKGSGGHDHDNPTWKAMLGGIFAFLCFDALLGIVVPDAEQGHGHSHGQEEKDKKKVSEKKAAPSYFSVAVVMSLFGDAMHNFMDGITLYAAFAVSYNLGVSTVVAVMAHEFPHEVGDFAVLLANGHSRVTASLSQVVTAVAMLAGCMIGDMLGGAEAVEGKMLPFVAGTMLYLALCTLLSDVNVSTQTSGLKAFNVIAFALGVLAMEGVTFIEETTGLGHSH